MVVATSVGQVLPVLMTALTSQLHLTIGQSGMLAAADMGASTLASVVCARTSARVPLAIVAFSGTVITVLANLTCLFAHGFGELLALRLIAGLGEGLLTIACVVVLSNAPSPRRAFALGAFAQTAFGMALNIAIPQLTARFGWSSCFVVLAVFAAPGLRTARYLTRPERSQVVSTATSLTVAAWLAIIAMTIAFCGIGATWANLGGLGQRALLSAATIGVAVSGASIAAPVASILTAVIGNRISSLISLAFASAAMLIGVGLLSGAGDAMLFCAGTIAFMFGWVVYVPNACGVTAALDSTGAATVIATAGANGGFALGPILAVPAISLWGLGAVPYLTFGLLAVAFCLFGPVARQRAA
jgi:MFS family permease